jgi:hypothetical protein
MPNRMVLAGLGTGLAERAEVVILPEIDLDLVRRRHAPIRGLGVPDGVDITPPPNPSLCLPRAA